MRKSRRLLLGSLTLLLLTAGVIVGRSWLRGAETGEAPQREILAPTPDVQTLARDAAMPQASAPAEPQPIEPENVALAEAHLKDWFKAWKAVAAGFDIRLFKKVMEGDIGGYSYPPGTWRLDERRRPLYVFSPDRTRFVDPYGGMELVEVNGRLMAAFDIDSSVTLYDLKTSQALRLAFCGTTCTFDDAIWLSNDLIAVVGRSEEWSCGTSSQPCSWVPMLILFDLSRKTNSIYLGPELHPSQDIGYFRTRLKQRLPGINF